MEASPSPVYGARLLSGFGLIPIASSNLAASANVKAPQPRVAGPFMSPVSLGRSVEQWWERVQALLDEVIDPAEQTFHQQARAQVATDRWGRPPIMAELKTQARERGRRNPFLSGTEHGAGLTNLEYAPGRALWPFAGASARGDELRRARLREHGGLRAFRQPCSAGAMADAIVGRDDSVRLLHDRAGGRVPGRHQHRHPHRA